MTPERRKVPDAGGSGENHRRPPGSVGRAYRSVRVISTGVQCVVQPDEKRAFGVGTPNTIARGQNVGFLMTSIAPKL